MGVSCASLSNIIDEAISATISADESITAVNNIQVEMPETLQPIKDIPPALTQPLPVADNVQPSSSQPIPTSSPMTNNVVPETIVPKTHYSTITAQPPSFNPDSHVTYSSAYFHRPSLPYDVIPPSSSTFNFPPYPPPQSNNHSYPPALLPAISHSALSSHNVNYPSVQRDVSQIASQMPQYFPPTIQPSVANDFRTYSHPPPQLFSSPIRSHTKVDVTKWNLTFDGSSSGIPVEKFFFRLEHLANSHDVPMHQLVNDLGFLLHGTAREHYWMLLERNPHSNLAQLRDSFIHRFQDRRSDIDIRHAIDSRKQRPKESFIDFYYDVLNLALPLKSTLSECDLINILRRNMRPGLKIALAGETFATISSLVSRCVATEDAWKSVGHTPEFNMSYQRNINEMYTSNSFDHPTYPTNPDPAVPSEYVQRVEAIRLGTNTPNYNNPPAPQLSNQNNKLVCWNCGLAGHLYSDCDLVPQRIFCYGCGTHDVLKPHCTKCTQKAGNFGQGMRAPGSSPFRYPPPPRPTTMEAASNTDRELKVRRQ